MILPKWTEQQLNTKRACQLCGKSGVQVRCETGHYFCCIQHMDNWWIEKMRERTGMVAIGVNCD